jgi:hypothetical protein
MCVPKEIMWCFLCGTGLWEMDLIASHQQTILERYPDQEFTRIAEHVHDTKGFRTRMAAKMGVSYESCKKLLQVLNYGGSPKKWMELNKVPGLPDEIEELQSELATAVRRDAENYPEELEKATAEGRRRPDVTIMHGRTCELRGVTLS